MYKILLVTEQFFYPDSSGGSEISTAYLLDSLHRKNWQIEVICTCSFRSPSFRKTSWKDLNKLRVSVPALVDRRQGYTIWRLMSKFANTKRLINFLDERLEEYQPDLILGLGDINCPLLNHALKKKYNCFYIARVAEFMRSADSIPKGLNIIANSPFMNLYLRNLTGKKYEIILPFIEQDKYKVKNRQRKYVTFINPVPQKGVELVIEVAKKLSNVDFLFVKGNWFHYRGNEEIFIQEARLLPNIKIWEHQEDSRSIYEVTDILLVPSIFNETFGRIILEAQTNSIPVIASKVGGIEYTLGTGGILIDSDASSQAYVESIERLKFDQKFYSDVSKLAFANSQRSEFNPDFQVNNFIEILNNYLKS